MIMIEIQCRGTALLLLVNPHILQQNNGTACPSYINYCLKRRQFVAGYVQPAIKQNRFNRTSAIKVATIPTTAPFGR